MSFRSVCLLAFVAVGLSACVTPSWMGGEKPSVSPKQQRALLPPASQRQTPPASPITLPQPPLATASPAVAASQNFTYSSNAAYAAPRVALLLPLSGKNAPLGKAMQNAAQMAVFELASENFELLPRDAGSTPESAANAARTALAQGAQLIIGPVFASDVMAVKQVMDTTNLSLLSLSSDTSLANPHCFVMGFDPSSFVHRIISYAAHRGLSRFAVLVPSGAYGKIIHAAYLDSVAESRAQSIAEESYGNIHEIDRAVRALAAKGNSIDALLIPAGDQDLRQIATSLAAAGFDKTKIKFLGTGLWDDPSLGKIDLLSGGWFAASEPEAREAFTKTYLQNYGHKPPRLATLAYDATALAAILVRQGQRFDRASLTNPNGFAGTDGTFRLTGHGTVERTLAVLEVTSNGARVIDPALSTFAGR